MKPNEVVAEHFNQRGRYYANFYRQGIPSGHFFNQRLALVYELLANHRSAKILDLGCGPGLTADHLLKQGHEFFGIDISEVMIDECRRRFPDSASAHFSVGDFQKLDFPDHSFDVILCMGALEYIDHDKVDRAVAEMTRVLKPDGVVIFSLLSEQSLYNWTERAGWRAKPVIRRLLGLKRDVFQPLDRNTLLFNEERVRSLLESHGFIDTECTYFCANITNPFVDHRFPKLSMGLIRIMEKLCGSTLARWRLRWPYRAFITTGKRSAACA